MMVLGIDPGPVWCGWAVLDFSILGAPVWFWGGQTNDVGSLLEACIASAHGKPELVAIEQPRVMHDNVANVHVMSTAWGGGRVQGHAEARGFATLAVGVNEWRQAFVGQSKRGDNVDAKVKEMFYRIVRQAPRQTSTHARDAAGVAIVGARRWRQRPGQVRAIGGET